jgi:hypothetical protein
VVELVQDGNFAADMASLFFNLDHLCCVFSSRLAFNASINSSESSGAQLLLDLKVGFEI